MAEDQAAEEKQECGWCKWMKAGGCGAEFQVDEEHNGMCADQSASEWLHLKILRFGWIVLMPFVMPGGRM